MKQGIITGCNERHEWMLKTWWHYYSQTNTYPVTFMDFGMTKSARLWCEKRGQVIPIELPIGIPVPKEKIDPKIQKEWETDYKDPWQARNGWFYKPFALPKSPYEQTYWIDIDTFIIKPLNPLFGLDLNKIALTKEVPRVIDSVKLHPGQTLYASGIVGYSADNPLIKKWPQKTNEWNHLYLGDQDILSRLIYESKASVTILPDIYNWRLVDGMKDDVAIIHFAHTGKQTLYINLETGIE